MDLSKTDSTGLEAPMAEALETLPGDAQTAGAANVHRGQYPCS